MSEHGAQIDNPYNNYIALSRYARWLPEKNRRESWGESVERYVSFITKHAKLDKNISNEISANIFELNVMPSMRALMTAGPALARDNTAGYNCSFIPVDSPRAFDEAMYILMCGTGLGFSVESQYVSKLPTISEHFEDSSTIIRVGDSKAGWSRAFKELLALLWQGQVPSWDMTAVRPAGARLETFGGRASGPGPLEDLFKFCVDHFKNAAGRKLKTIEAHDIMCKIGEVVVVGGVRRSAMISGSDLGDYSMSKAKSGEWWSTTPHRRLANNSAVYESKPSIGEFLREWSYLYESKSGERGIFNKEGAKKQASSTGRRDGSQISFTNPCGEIFIRSHQFCNLSEIVIRKEDTLDSLKNKVRIGTIIGTIQSTLTDFKYLRKIWKDNCEDERLLGVSLTGHFGHQVMSGSEGLELLAEWLRELRIVAIDTNKEWASKLGVKPSAAITTVKPSGTVSQLTGVSSGMHPWHSEHYIRTIRSDNNDPLTQFMKDIGVPNEPDIMAKTSTTIFSFPVTAPSGAITRDHVSAIEHLELWKVYKLNWTDHNPSITVNVRDDEWLTVAAWVYENWDDVCGISFLPYDDHVYQQAPYTSCTVEELKALQERMPGHIDWAGLSDYETEDTTKGVQELACVSGSCDIDDYRSSIESSPVSVNV